MFDKNSARLRRARKTRAKIRQIDAVRLTVTRTNSHIYAQITAGGWGKQPGDYFYGDQRRPLTQAGSWGLMRVLSDATCPIRPLDGGSCLGTH